ncbi:DNA polymerase III subunit chi [Flaviflagellibacter deserti]|uniref:DNA polymerase III subunit chi n=1 Tax=Flaviflagellibacter deserti TaxID=2267266 RepID=A0ABV9Z1F1_9HYPH
MTEVFFYHLQQQPLERVLPVLLERCLERGWKVVVQAGSDERVRALDELLWTFSDESFLPHGTEAEGKPEMQPILLTASDINPNGAQVRVLVDGAEGPDLGAYIRAMVLFDGNDEDVVAGERLRWKALKAAGHEIAYWQQDDSGRWVKRA